MLNFIWSTFRAVLALLCLGHPMHVAAPVHPDNSTSLRHFPKPSKVPISATLTQRTKFKIRDDDAKLQCLFYHLILLWSSRDYPSRFNCNIKALSKTCLLAIPRIYECTYKLGSSVLTVSSYKARQRSSCLRAPHPHPSHCLSSQFYYT